MADKYDGSIIINTKIDDTGFEKGTDDLIKAMESLQKTITGLGEKMEQSMSTYAKKIFAGTQNIQQQRQKTDQLTKAQKNLNTVQKNSEAVRSTEEQIEATDALTESHKKLNQEITSGQKTSSRKTSSSSATYAQGLLDSAEKAAKNLQKISSEPLSIDIKTDGTDSLSKQAKDIQDKLQIDSVKVDTGQAEKNLDQLSKTAKDSTEAVKGIETGLNEAQEKAAAMDGAKVSITAEVQSEGAAESIEGIREQTEDLRSETEELGTTVEDVYLSNADAMLSNADALDTLKDKTDALADSQSKLRLESAATAQGTAQTKPKTEIHNTSSQLVQDKLNAWLHEAEEIEDDPIEIEVDTSELEQATEKAEEFRETIEKPVEAKTGLESVVDECNEIEKKTKEFQDALSVTQMDANTVGADEVDQAIDGIKSRASELQQKLENLKAAGEKAASGSASEMRAYQQTVAEVRAEVDEAYNELLRIGDLQVDSDELKELDEAIRQTESDLGNLMAQNREKWADPGSYTVQEWKDMQAEITACQQSLQELHQERNDLIASGQGTVEVVDSAQFEEAAGAMGEVESEMSAIEGAAGGLEGVVTILAMKLAQGMQKVASKAKQAASAMAEMVKEKIKAGLKKIASNASKAAKSLASMASKGILSGIKKLGSAFTSLFNSQKKSNGGFTSGLSSILKYGLGVRSLFSLISKLKSALTEGFGNLAAYDAQFNKTMSDFVSALAKLKNAFATAFAPIVEVVIPYLTQLINWCTSAVDSVAQFFAALTGKTTYTKAGDVQKDYAADVAGTTKDLKDQEKQAKETQKTLAGFDDVEILKDNSSSDSSSDDSSNNPEISFETAGVEADISDFAQKIKDAWEAADFTGIGRMVGEKLRDALNNIDWPSIKKTLKKIAKSIATFLNGFLETPGLFDAIGKTLAEALNSAFEFLNAFAENFHWDSLGKAIKDGILGFCNNIDWPLIYSTFKNYGAGIGTALEAALDNPEIWTAMLSTIANGINVVVNGISSFINAIQWLSLGQNIATGLNNAMAVLDWALIGQTFADGMQAAIDLLNGFLTEFNWLGLGQNLAAMMQSAWIGINWTDAFMVIVNAFNGLIDLIRGFFENVQWSEFGTSVGEGLHNAFGEIDYVGLGTAIADILNAAFDWCYNFLSELDFTRFGTYVGGAISTALNETDWVEGGASVGLFITGLFNALDGFLQATDWKLLGQSIIDVIAGFFSTFDWGSVASTISHLFTALLDTCTGLISEIDWWNLPNNILNAIWDFLSNFDWIGVLKSIFNLIVEALLAVIKLAGGLLETMVSIAGQMIESWFNGICACLEGLGTWIDEHIVQPFLTWFFKLFGLDDAEASEMAKAGGEIIAGFYNGIKNAIKGVGEWIREHIVDPFFTWFKSLFGIASPSKITQEYGGYIIEGFYNGIKSAIKNVGTWIKTNIFQPFINGFKNLFGIGSGSSSAMSTYGGHIITGLYDGIKSKITGVKDWLKTNVFDKFMGGIKNLFGINSPSTEMKEQGKYIAAGLQEGVEDGMSDMSWVKKKVYEAFMDAVIDAFEIKNGVSYAVMKEAKAIPVGFQQGIIQQLGNILDWTKTYVYKPFMNSLESLFDISGSTSRIMRDLGEDLITSLEDGIRIIMNGIKTYVKGFITQPFLTELKNNLSKSVMSTIGAEAITNLLEGMQRVNVTSYARYIKQEIVSSFDGLYNSMYRIGQDAIRGLNNGICDWWNNSNIRNNLNNIASGIQNAIANALGIHSPSTVMRDEVGQYIGLGLADGIKQSEQTVLNSMADLASDVVDAADDTEADFELGMTLTDGLDEALTAFGNKVESSFLTLIDSLDTIVSQTTFTFPAVATGSIQPYAVKAGAASTGTDLAKLQETVTNLQNEMLDKDSAASLVNTLVQAIQGISVYISDENLARHVSNGQAALTRRFSSID